MAGFVKIDCNILTSSLWPDRDVRDVFLTAVIMATPHELLEKTAQLSVAGLDPTGWWIEPGWYGLVRASGVGIIEHSKVGREQGIMALQALGEPDPDSRSREYDGRRLVRINGGYIVLNYIKYRERDYTSRERSKRWRERNQEKKRHGSIVSQRRDDTQAEYRVQSTEVQRTEEPKPAPRAVFAVAQPASVSEEVWQDFLTLRRKKAAPVTKTVLKRLESEAAKAGVSLEKVLIEMTVRGWHGFQAAWVADGKSFSVGKHDPGRAAADAAEHHRRLNMEMNRKLTEKWLQEQRAKKEASK